MRRFGIYLLLGLIAVAGIMLFVKAMLNPNVAIRFWARVLDQNDAPIAGAKVTFAVRKWTTYVRGIQQKYEETSDSEGRVELSGASGDVLSLESVTKPGYRLSERVQRAFSYNQSSEIFHPQPNNPVVIRMWKLGPTEPLVSIETLFGFEADGRPYTLDLLQNKKREGPSQIGDLIVSFSRSPIRQAREPYAWMVQVSAVDGGIVETRDEQPYLAPQTGYQQALTVRMDSADSNWAPSAAKNFYFSSRNGGVYGSVHMDFNANYNGGCVIQVGARANPHGSRNLQP